MADEWPRRPVGTGRTLDDDCWKIEATYKGVDLRLRLRAPRADQLLEAASAPTIQLPRVRLDGR